MKSSEEEMYAVERLKKEIGKAEAIVIGAGAGMSTAAGFIYTGERFDRYFGDFAEKYGFGDMYTGGFVVMNQSAQVMWAYWSRYIYINRYMDPPKPVYEDLLELVKDKDYFVLTTNVDHCFQKAGFDKSRLFYTQGDYGLWQCRSGRIKKTYDNEVPVKKMLLAQGFWFEHVKSTRGVTVEQDSEMIEKYGPGNAWMSHELDYEADWGQLLPPVEANSCRTDFTKLSMEVPRNMIPHCPDAVFAYGDLDNQGEKSLEDDSAMTMNLRADDTFVEDEGWHRAADAYSEFLRHCEDRQVLYLELGVGGNTPVIIKYPFWKMTMNNPKAVYVCVNYGEAFCPAEIKDRSICIDGDIAAVLEELKAE